MAESADNWAAKETGGDSASRPRNTRSLAADTSLTAMPSMTSAQPPADDGAKAIGDEPPADRLVHGTPVHRSSNVPLRKRALQTRDQLVNTAKSLFLQFGYAATTIDDIADAAGVSRASFYTYFSSKKEIMIFAGTEARNASCGLFEKLGEIDRTNIVGEIETWIDEYFRFLEGDGGYILTWQQAALKDAELRQLGMEGTQRSAKVLCASLRALGANGEDSDLLIRCLAIRSMLDRFWYHWWLTVSPYERKQVLKNLGAILLATISI